MDCYDVKDVGSGPIIAAICRQLKVREMINKVLPWDKKQCLVDPGTHLVAMVYNILSCRDPLYRVEEFYREQDLELLFDSCVEADYFNDDALGKTLDRIYKAGPKKVFSAVIARAMTEEEITYHILHADTTARLVYGEYREPVGLNIAHGYNKERRRDLKQYKIGLVVNKDGFPVIGDILDGNLDDKTWNKQLLASLPQHFNFEELKNIIYVADAALITEENLAVMGDKLKFISRLPETFSLAAGLIKKAFKQNNWLHLERTSPGKKSADYHGQEFRAELYGQNYRFVVVHTDYLDNRKLKGLDSMGKKKKTALEKAAFKLMKLTFACQADAEAALAAFLKEEHNEFYALSGTVEETTETVKRTKRGRPAKDEKPVIRPVYKIHLKIGDLDQDAYREERKRASCFVLISNIETGFSAFDLLKEYKQQSVVENRFRFIKHPVYVGPIWLKKKGRLEAMCYVILIALALYIILQQRVRTALLNENKPLQVTGKKESFTPTGNKILELFKPVKIVYIKEEGTVKRFLPKRYLELERALKMIGFNTDIFVKPPRSSSS